MLVAGTSRYVSFERLAPHYTWMERVLAGSRLQRCRVAWLEELAGCENLLIAGVGHGHFLRACTQRFPAACITSVDASAGMLSHARVRAGTNGGRLTYVDARLPEWRPPAATYDAIITNFFLDCFAGRELDDVIGVLAQAARPKARWLLADFMVPARGWRRRRARAIHAAMYAFFRPIAGVQARRVTPPDDHLQRHGFALSRRTTFELGLLHADLWTRGEPVSSQVVEADAR